MNRNFGAIAPSYQATRHRWLVLVLALWLTGLGLSSLHVHTEPVADLHCSLCQLGHGPALPTAPMDSTGAARVAVLLEPLPKVAPLTGVAATPSIRAPPAWMS